VPKRVMREAEKKLNSWRKKGGIIHPEYLYKKSCQRASDATTNQEWKEQRDRIFFNQKGCLEKLVVPNVGIRGRPKKEKCSFINSRSNHVEGGKRLQGESQR